MLSKQSLRAALRQNLQELSFFEIIKKSASLQEHFHRDLVSANLRWVHQKVIVSFSPLETEPQINIESEERDEPYQVAYGRIFDWEKRQMECRLARRDQPGEWEEINPTSEIRIHQPAKEQPDCPRATMGMILVPGLGFTQHGFRLGRGAGFYDRFLSQYPEILRVGVAFQEQVVETIPEELHDERVDVILTDQGLLETERFFDWQKHGKVVAR